MIKSELREIETLTATAEMMEIASKDGKFDNPTNGWPKNYERKYGYFIRVQEHAKCLKVTVFLPNNMKKGDDRPSYEIFLNVKGSQYITRVLVDGKEDKWSTSKIDNIEGGYYNSSIYYCQHNAWMDLKEYKKIKDWLGTTKGGYEGIREWQEKILRQRIEDKEKREVAPWDKDMELVPEIPESFEKWVGKEAITKNYIFYVYKKGGVKTGYCSYCEKEVPVSNPRHNLDGTCSCCGKKITYKSTGKIKTLQTEDESCQIIQRVDGGIVVRTFRIFKGYRNGGYKKPNIYNHEHRRILIRQGKFTTYDWNLYKNKYHRWVPASYSGYYSPTGLVFKRNLAALEKTVLMDSSLPIIVRMNRKVNVEKFLMEEKKNPAIEKLVKVGMLTMALDFYGSSNYDNNLSKRETELTKLLKIDKSRLSRLKKIDASARHLMWMQEEKKANTIWPDEMIDFFVKNNVEIKSLSFISKYMSYLKIANYIKKQQLLSNESINSVITTWKDYLNMAKNAKMQINLEQIYKPSNLKVAHTEMIVLLQSDEIDKQVKNRKKQFTKVERILKTLEKYAYYDDEKYIILAPKDIHDIIKEGIALQHCIHTCDYYFDRINRKESYILFLRKKDAPTIPYYTLEVEPSGNIRQKRTTGDNQNKDFDEAIGFLKRWQKQLTKKLSKEDIELGKTSDNLRKKEYEKLRKERAKIWNGKLAGQLLADVLEDDFMDVNGRCS